MKNKFGLRALIGLTSAFLIATPCAFAQGPDGIPKIVADARDGADWMAQALNSSGYKADFSLESLKEVDRFFDENSASGKPRPEGLLSEQLGARLFGLGSYVGETIRRAGGGEWVGKDEDPQAELNIAVKLKNGTTFWPVQRVMKRLQNGQEDGIATYGAALVSKR